MVAARSKAQSSFRRFSVRTLPRSSLVAAVGSNRVPATKMSTKSKPSSKVGGASSSSKATAAASSVAPAQPAQAAPQQTSPASATLQVFWDLAKEDLNDRLAACERLLAGLQTEQQAFAASGGKGGGKVVKNEDEENDDEEGVPSKLAPTVLATNLCPSLNYALKRLTRGLASSRAGARQGFALALTEILAHMPVVQTEDVLAIVADQVKLSSKANKQETRDYHLGRVFFALVLIRSGRAQSLSIETLTTFVHEILEYAKQNLPIREVSYETVSQLIKALPWKIFNGSKLQKYILKEFCNQQLENLSIEQIGLSLNVKEYYEKNGQELPQSGSVPASSSEDPKNAPLVVSSSVRKLFSSKYLPTLHTAMFASMQHYSIQEKLHTTWSTILLHLWRFYPAEKFAKFFKENVEEALFGGSFNATQQQQHLQLQQAAAGGAGGASIAKSTSYQKKFIGFQIVQQLLTVLPQAFEHRQTQAAAGALLHTWTMNQVLSFLFSSKNFMRTFMNNLSSSKNVLHTSTTQVKRAILTFSKQQPDTILTILNQLEDASSGGHQRFDARTNSNLVVKLLEGLNEQGVENYVEKLIHTFMTAAPVAPVGAGTGEGKDAPEAVSAPTPKKGGKKGAAQTAAPTTAAAIDSLDQAELAQQALDSARAFVVEQLFLLARNKNLPGQSTGGKWMNQALEFLFYFGFFASSASSKSAAPFTQPTHAVSSKTRALVQEKLFHLLNELLPHAPVGKRVGGKDEKDAGDKKGDKKANKKKTSADEDVEMEDAESKPESTAEESLQAFQSFHALFSASSSKDASGNKKQVPWVLQLHRDWSAWTSASSGKKSASASATTLLEPLEGEEAKAREDMLAFVDDLRQRYSARLTAANGAPLSEDDKVALNQLRSLQLLVLHLGLLLLRTEEREFAAPLLQEIQEGAAEFFKAQDEQGKKKKASKKASKEDDADKPQFINVLIDILLSLLIRPSTLFRDIAKNTFLAFVTQVNEEALDELLAVLRRKDKVTGADDEDEDSDNFPSSEEDEEEDEDMEEKKSNKHGKGSKKDEKSGSGGAAAKKPTEKLNQLDPRRQAKNLSLDQQAAANAAKYAKYAAKENSDSDAEDDDAQMLDIEGLNKVFAESDEESDGEDLAQAGGKLDSYDTHLSNIVRLRNERKIVHKETMQQSLHFKLRVCDLIEIFVKNQASNPLTLRIHIPLLLAIDASRGNKENLQLQQRLVGLYKKLASQKEHPEITPERETEIKALMTTLMARAAKTINRETLHLTNLGVMSLAKSILPREGLKEQIEAALAATSGKKSKTESPTAFVLSLYKTELVKYLSIRHASHLNTKFFTDFFGKFPGLSWTFVEELAALARAKLPEEMQEKASSKAAGKTNDATKDLYAASDFRRIECFTLLLAIFNRRGVLKDHGVSSKFLPSVPYLVEAVRSALLVATVPKSERDEDEKDSDDEESDEDEEKDGSDEDDASEDEDAAPSDKEKSSAGTDKAKMSKKDREKLRARAKKKRRVAKQKAAAKLAAAAAAGTVDAEAVKAKQAADAHRSNLNRLKVVLKCANQAALALEGQGMQSLASTFSALPATLATPLKSAVTTFLLSAKIDPAKVKLQLDPTLLNKPNPNQLVKTEKKKPASAAGGKGDKKSDAASAATAPSKKKSNNRNLIQPSASPHDTAPSSSPAALKESKKRPADSSSNGHSDERKKQKVASSASPASSSSASPKESKKHQRQQDDEDEQEPRKKKVKA